MDEIKGLPTIAHVRETLEELANIVPKEFLSFEKGNLKGKK